MTDDSLNVLQSVRIGSVPYLNAKPLVFGLNRGVLFRHPSLLAEDFSAGRVDVALLPLRSVLEMENVVAVDGVSISSFGPVYSVFLAYRGALQDIRKIHLDPASRSSANLLRVVCHRFLKLDPEFIEADAAGCDARLLIGDQAMHFRKNISADWNIFDLGEAWTEFTKLPFVYAVWAIREGIPKISKIAQMLRETKQRGVAAFPEIIGHLPADERDTGRDYLGSCIRYGLGVAEKEAIARFADYLVEQGLLKKAQKLRYI